VLRKLYAQSQAMLGEGHKEAPLELAADGLTTQGRANKLGLTF